jgi:hypothetical protein
MGNVISGPGSFMLGMVFASVLGFGNPQHVNHSAFLRLAIGFSPDHATGSRIPRQHWV